ncbi:hypothetical protein [Phycisphaera mikurensis]|uniref:Uncharacterized protein n=1 Tax=Phycisphaera mikurensis (strain NBRC 102666 / KCTC 22515 / FYK2301M01) TaxID=1142394 RepID=I0IFN9_PHYMF|nr:hypothetical protein [Phycisphaera mikurensis]MBB6440533.1 hypothetical protein [Phycisphaera mikurensis]BAM04077.1 hypothetical protein PSMK_19180 [Phycisphaera mikurensis NBRC 102666]
MSSAPTPAPAPRTRAEAAARRWLLGWAIAAAALAGLTYLVRTWPEALGLALGPLDLGRESNIAAWFSACSLLWAGLLMGSAAAALRRAEPLAAAAAAVTAGVAFSLCVDEAGSLHERFDLLVPASLGLSLERFAAVLAVPALAAVAVLFLRRRALGNAWALVLAAYALFGTVFVQEHLEHAVAWPPALLPLRMLVEEGTELVGFFLLLLAAVRLRRRSRAGTPAGDPAGRHALVLPARGVALLALLAAACAAPALAAWMLSIPFKELQLAARGDFASSLPMAMYLIAGALCLRAACGDDAAAGRWSWVAAACFALSLLQNWNLYTDATALALGRTVLPLWRSGFDMAWALPLFIAVALAARRGTGMKPWTAGLFAAAWLVTLAACTRDGFKLAYASDCLTAWIVCGWAAWATRARPA